MTSRPRLCVMQAGGPTAVLNTSLLGVVRGARDRAELYAVGGGPAGLVAGTFTPLDATVVEQRHRRAGALLGAGRLAMSDADVEHAVRMLETAGIDGLVVIGGNGSMTLASRLAEAGRSQGLSVMGAPKTVDNDVVQTDRAPGFASAAAFVIDVVRNLADDQQAMGGLEDVRLVETIGRDVGWVALASLAARDGAQGPPHLVYAPEMPFTLDQFLSDITNAHDTNGPLLVVVAEGFAGELTDQRFQQATFDRPLLGGVVHQLADRIRDKLGLTVRAEVLGMIQRAATSHVTPIDRNDAELVGRAAIEALLVGANNSMVALSPLDRESAVVPVELPAVAGLTRPLPTAWLPRPQGPAPAEFLNWLQPLIDRSEGESAGRPTPADPSRQTCEGKSFAIPKEHSC